MARAEEACRVPRCWDRGTASRSGLCGPHWEEWLAFIDALMARTKARYGS